MAEKLTEYLKNKEDLKLMILSYKDSEMDIIQMSPQYHQEHWPIFKKPKEEKVTFDDFWDRLYEFILIRKVSDLLVYLYLENSKGINPTIWQLNRYLKRTEKQYSYTFKIVDRLERLNIVKTEYIPNSPRREKAVMINKSFVALYGDDEFRQMMLDDWDITAKEYTFMKLKEHKEDKAKLEQKIKMMKKGRRG